MLYGRHKDFHIEKEKQEESTVCTVTLPGSSCLSLFKICDSGFKNLQILFSVNIHGNFGGRTP